MQALASIDKLRADRDRRAAEIAKRFPTYADLIDRSRRRSSDRARCSPARRCCRSISAATRASSGPCRRRAGGVCRDPGDGRRHRDQDPQAARGAGAAGGDRSPTFRRSIWSSRMSSTRCCSSRWRPAGSSRKLDRGHQRRARPAAAVAVADRAGRDQGRPRRRSPPIATCHGWRAPMRSPWCRRRRRCGRCGRLPPGSAKRERMIGFGDPYFSDEQAGRRRRQGHRRRRSSSRWRTRAACRSSGAPRRSSKASTAPSSRCCRACRTPPTNCRSIALALRPIPSKVLHLGRAGQRDGGQERRPVALQGIVFATHGLVPGELERPDAAGAGAVSARTSRVSTATGC